MEINERKKEFQLERIIFFSDAVFAIAITLLIIDIRVPFHEGLTNQDLFQALIYKIPSIAGFLMSFFFIGYYWVIHHKLFGYVKRFNGKLIWINLFFLLSIVLLPFTTSIFGNYGNLTLGLCLYIGNALFTGIMNFICWKHILNPSHNLTFVEHDKQFRRAAYVRSLLTPGWFLVCGIVALIAGNAFVGEMMLPIVGVWYAVYSRLEKKQHAKQKISS